MPPPAFPVSAATSSPPALEPALPSGLSPGSSVSAASASSRSTPRSPSSHSRPPPGLSNSARVVPTMNLARYLRGH